MKALLLLNLALVGVMAFEASTEWGFIDFEWQTIKPNVSLMVGLDKDWMERGKNIELWLVV